MDSIKDLRLFLREKLESGEVSQNYLAKQLGITQATISRFSKGTTGIDAEAAFKIMKFFDIQIQPRTIIKRLGPFSPTEEVKGENLPKINVVAIAGAGGGVDNSYNLEPLNTIAVLEQYARPNLFACKVKGKSMEPTIKEGGYIGVLPLDGPLLEGAVYLVWDPNFGERVKRIFLGEPGTIVLRSDNKEYRDETINIEGYERVVIGKVEWVWQEC